LNGARVDRGAKSPEHGGGALHCKARLAAISGTIESDYEAIADQLVGADAFNIAEFLYTRGLRWVSQHGDGAGEQE
jgi:hypothetical protein